MTNDTDDEREETPASSVGLHDPSNWVRLLSDIDDMDRWPSADDERVADGGTHLLQLISAVDYLRRGLRPGFTVWDALEEALRWHNIELTTLANGAPQPGADEIRPNDPDPLLTQLRQLVDLVDTSDIDAAPTTQQAVRRWVTAMANAYNRGHPWPDPTPRQSFPPPSP